MQITRLKIQYLPTTVLIVLGALFYLLSSANVATAGTYADSAHGDPTFGVNRSTAACENWPGEVCSIGDCTHCHDTFDPSICGVNELMLFADVFVSKSNQFCQKCHCTDATYQAVTNYPYCVTFGGRTAFYGTIKKQFTDDNSQPDVCGSRHNTAKIRNIIKDNGYDWGFGADPSPCSACHNPHLAQRIGSSQYHPPYDPDKSLITRPSERYNNPVNLWGDDPSERMNQYASQFTDGQYQAPYYGSPGDPISGPFEPANDDTADGSNLPDYVTFCLDCHQYPQYDPDRDADVKAINYSAERHGGYPSNDCSSPMVPEGTLKPPYSDFPNSNYVLSCLDCHEPHGTHKRLHLIRRMINGEEVPADAVSCDENEDWTQICERCHDLTGHSTGSCVGCHHYHGGICPPGGTCTDKPCF